MGAQKHDGVRKTRLLCIQTELGFGYWAFAEMGHGYLLLLLGLEICFLAVTAAFAAMGVIELEESKVPSIGVVSRC